MHLVQAFEQAFKKVACGSFFCAPCRPCAACCLLLTWSFPLPARPSPVPQLTNRVQRQEAQIASLQQQVDSLTQQVRRLRRWR